MSDKQFACMQSKAIAIYMLHIEKKQRRGKQPRRYCQVKKDNAPSERSGASIMYQSQKMRMRSRSRRKRGSKWKSGTREE